MRNIFRIIYLGLMLVVSTFMVYIAFHELTHVLLMEETHLIGFVFNDGVIAEVCGVTRNYDQELAATFWGAFVAVIWFITGVVAIKKYIDVALLGDKND